MAWVADSYPHAPRSGVSIPITRIRPTPSTSTVSPSTTLMTVPVSPARTGAGCAVSAGSGGAPGRVVPSPTTHPPSMTRSRPHPGTANRSLSTARQ